jgi:AcrR family transcriptional regulator
VARGSEDGAEPIDALPPVAARAVRRALAARESTYNLEVQRLLEAGLSLMSEGEKSPRVVDIVKRAGLSNQAFYRHFEGKDELVAAVFDSGAYRLDTYLRHQVDKAGTPIDQLRAWIRGVLSQARPAVAAQTRAALAAFRLLPVDSQVRQNPPAGMAVLTEILTDLGTSDPERDANAIGLLSFGRLDQLLWSGPPSRADEEHIFEFCLAALKH